MSLSLTSLTHTYFDVVAMDQLEEQLCTKGDHWLDPKSHVEICSHKTLNPKLLLCACLLLTAVCIKASVKSLSVTLKTFPLLFNSLLEI